MHDNSHTVLSLYGKVEAVAALGVHVAANGSLEDDGSGLCTATTTNERNRKNVLVHGCVLSQFTHSACGCGMMASSGCTSGTSKH